MVYQAITDDDAVRGDVVFANLPTVGSAAHLHNHHDFAKLTINLRVVQPYDVVGQERYLIGTER